jgi:glycosyltransferase involved in cell wall biosynthesis
MFRIVFMSVRHAPERVIAYNGISFMNKVSIVIPVYNEAQRITACLEAIARQTVMPYEVIVVDNNSTDDTVAAVQRFPFVTVITAKRQGVVHARNRGFNAARGDIIGRIDADTWIPTDWVETLQTLFQDDIDAVSGAVSYHDIPVRRLLSAVDLTLRRQAAKSMGDEVFLLGANMAVRRTAWHVAKRNLCARGGMHEDFDLAIHLSEASFRVCFREELTASISARCLDDTVKDFWTYALLSPGTYAQHNVRAGRHMYLIVVLVLLFHVPLRALYRGANQNQMYHRVNPATFVD